jgi:hypothetical protein
VACNISGTASLFLILRIFKWFVGLSRRPRLVDRLKGGLPATDEASGLEDGLLTLLLVLLFSTYSFSSENVIDYLRLNLPKAASLVG